MSALSMHSPLGPLTVAEEDGAIVALDWGWSPDSEETGLLCLVRSQLGEYFDGMRQSFNLALAPRGTPFQRQVWARLMDIPYGQTESYAGIARVTDSGPRAIGTACATNPIPILIPCHRVVGRDGALTGYSGGDGIGSKQYLLRLEGWAPAPAQTASLLSTYG